MNSGWISKQGTWNKIQLDFSTFLLVLEEVTVIKMCLFLFFSHSLLQQIGFWREINIRWTKKEPI